MTGPNTEATVVGKWRGSVIRVDANASPRKLWQNVSIDVFVDNACVLSTACYARFAQSATSAFENLGSSHAVKLNFGPRSIRSAPYTLLIDGIVIIASRVRIQNWYLGLISAVVMAVILFVLCYARYYF
jgi:hypothetical protein